ncbi:MAG: S41 family peptidase [Pseudomonadota bacterium]
MSPRSFLTSAAAALITLAALNVTATDAPPADPWSEDLAPDVIRADFADLYDGLKSAHADLYAQRNKAEYDARFEATLATFTQPMSRFDVQMAFQRFAAYGNVGHARIDFPNEVYQSYRENGGKVLALYPRVVDGVIYVGDNYTGDDRIRAGDELVAIDGEPMSRWLQRAAEHISADTPYLAQSLMEFTFPRDLWVLAGERDAFEVSLRRGAKPFTLKVRTTTSEQQQSASSGTPDAFALDSSARTYRMIDDTIAYLMPGPFYNIDNPSRPWDNAAFLAFIDEAFHHFLENDATELIIDLRQNPGGDNSFSDPMLAWFADEPFRFYSEFLIRSSDQAAAANAARLDAQGDPESVSAKFAQRYDEVPRGEVFAFDLPFAQPRDGKRFEGRVTALVNRHSFSNAVNVAAIIQDYEFGLIAGEKTSDMATTYGSMEQFTLTRTGINVGFPKAHIIRPSGARTPDGVTPDWAITSPTGPRSEDVVLNELIERLRAD